MELCAFYQNKKVPIFKLWDFCNKRLKIFLLKLKKFFMFLDSLFFPCFLSNITFLILGFISKCPKRIPWLCLAGLPPLKTRGFAYLKNLSISSKNIFKPKKLFFLECFEFRKIFVSVFVRYFCFSEGSDSECWLLKNSLKANANKQRNVRVHLHPQQK